MRNIETPYLTQYCSMLFEWHNHGVDIDNVSENQILQLQELQAKAIEQSGLTLNELTLICICREHRILKKVNVYANKIKLLLIQRKRFLFIQKPFSLHVRMYIILVPPLRHGL